MDGGNRDDANCLAEETRALGPTAAREVIGEKKI